MVLGQDPRMSLDVEIQPFLIYNLASTEVELQHLVLKNQLTPFRRTKSNKKQDKDGKGVVSGDERRLRMVAKGEECSRKERNDRRKSFATIYYWPAPPNESVLTCFSRTT